MGLDMYLTKEKRKTDRRCKTGYRVTDKQDVCYWRKANAIRGWLVSHKVIEEDDNCVPREIDRDTIHELLGDCEKVIAKFNTSAKNRCEETAHDFFESAKEILPPSEGFFFGNYEIDEYYIEEILETIDKLNTVLETTSEEDTLVYSDWW